MPGQSAELGRRQHLTVGAGQLSLAQPAGRLAHGGGPITLARYRPEVADRDGGAVAQYDLAGQFPLPRGAVHLHIQPSGVTGIDHHLAHGAGTGTEVRHLGRGVRSVTGTQQTGGRTDRRTARLVP